MEAKKIVKSNEDQFSKWGVTDEGYVVNETGKDLSDVLEYLKGDIKKAGVNLDEYDYFGTGIRESQRWPVLYRRVFAFACPGSNEGHYIHLSTEHMDGTFETLFIGKTFMGLDHALDLSNTLSRILDDNYR